MTAYNRGDVVLVGFVFSDESGKKVRPALVVSSPACQRGRQELVVAAITSNVRRRLLGEHVVSNWKRAGLLFPSPVTGVLRTIKRAMVDRRLGAMPEPDMQAVDRELRRSLGL